MNELIAARHGNDDEVLFRLELMVARRADRLARGAGPGPSEDRRSWQLAEQEVFGHAAPATLEAE